jgi:indolepyruvate decarboxylase
MSATVIEHVLSRLKAIGISQVFGVAGDYAFSVDDTIATFPGIEWVGCCNELNAAYAADGYARIRGVGAVCTTYGVGELSAINAIAGAYAEHLPVFHLVGMPNMPTQAGRALVHHTLGNGEFDLFRKMAEPVVSASAVMTPQNVAYETERLIAEALYHRRPVYMAFPADVANQVVVSGAQPLDPPLAIAPLSSRRPMRSAQLWKERAPRASCRDSWRFAQVSERRCSPLLMPPVCPLPRCSWISQSLRSSIQPT